MNHHVNSLKDYLEGAFFAFCFALYTVGIMFIRFIIQRTYPLKKMLSILVIMFFFSFFFYLICIFWGSDFLKWVRSMWYRFR